MAQLGICPRCFKVVYSTWKHAQNDATALNRKKMRTGHQHPYICPAGHIHVGRHTTMQRKRAKR